MLELLSLLKDFGIICNSISNIVSSVARHTERNYGIGMLKLWYTMVHVCKTHAQREIQINIISNTSKFNIFYK